MLTELGVASRAACIPSFIILANYGYTSASSTCFFVVEIELRRLPLDRGEYLFRVR
jgi:hypothetical protein